jgi:hypothetical protein
MGAHEGRRARRARRVRPGGAPNGSWPGFQAFQPEFSDALPTPAGEGHSAKPTSGS